jgi:hypothetical protein
MSKYLCELPWLTVCAVCAIVGTLLLIGSFLPPRYEEDASMGCAGLAFGLFGSVGLVVWAVLRFLS